MQATVAPSLHLPDAAATDRLGAHVGEALRSGDCLLLDGPVGAGKTALARAAIRARQAAEGQAPEDVPSPTFTLVQTYRAGPLEIWHADLYRLGDPSELAELGLEDALEAAACLIEWPDRLGDLAPAGALRLTLSHDGNGRRLHATGPDAALARLLPSEAAQ